MPPHRPCVAVGCRSEKSAASAVSFFRFPREPVKRKAWERNVGRKDWAASNGSLLCSEHFTADCYEADVHLASEFGIRKRRRLRADATPTVFAHRPMLQAKRRGAFEKRQRKEIIDALLKQYSTVYAQEKAGSSSSQSAECDSLDDSPRDASIVDSQEKPGSSSSRSTECDNPEFSGADSTKIFREKSGMAECSGNVQHSLPISESCDIDNAPAQQCSKYVQAALRASCRSTGTQTAPKGVSSSTQTLGTFLDKKNCSAQT